MEKILKGSVEEKLNQLAKLKKQAKALEVEIKERQVDLIENEGVACDTITPFGKLAFSVRESYEVVDKIGLIKFLGQKAYNAHSTITKTGITKAIGELGFREAVDKDLVNLKNIAQYFILRK